MKFLTLLILILSVFSLYAMETDNYMVWDRDLKDSTEAINGYFKEQIQTTLNEINESGKSYSCLQTTFAIAKKFKTLPPGHKPLEDWLIRNLDENQIYPKTYKFLDETIYREPYRFYLIWIDISPTVQVNGFYFGIDKLSHFVSTGRRYFRLYTDARRWGKNEKKATEKAIRMGLTNEATIIGLMGDGVYSYGDVEANYQGLQLYKNFCFESENPYLKQEKDNSWTQVRDFDIRDYVSAYWDETFNLSYRLHFNWTRVSKVIKEKYCPLIDSQRVKDRMKYYTDSNHTSYSLEYIKELQKILFRHAPLIPQEQSVERLCAKPLMYQ